LSTDEHHRKLERLYGRARCNEYYAPRIAISEGRCELVIPVREAFFHSAGAVHGSVYFKALDDAGFFAVNSLIEDVLVLTVTFSISFLRPISEGELRAHGEVVHRSGRLVFADAMLRDASDRLIGRGSGCWTRSGIRLAPETDYW
jgi:uncharacterized protein (TIGR00369 family)